MKTRTVAILIFINARGEILLQKRGAYSKRGEDVAFFGGGVEAGETHQQTLIREMREELNLTINIADCRYAGEFLSENPDGSVTFRHTYLMHTEKEARDFEVLEGESVFFTSIEEARKLRFPSDVTRVLDFLTNIR
jgi:mutator protein MutT